jgi:hypothetical protein
MNLPLSSYLGSLATSDDASPLPGGRWFTANAENDGFDYRFVTGMLQGMTYLTADFLLAGDELVVLGLLLQEGEAGPVFTYSFGLLNGCQARLRLPLEAVNQNRWMYPREGALLKPLCYGARVDLARVDRARLIVRRFSGGTEGGGKPARWCQTDLRATTSEPPLLEVPLLTNGVLLDELGQCAFRDWPGKTRTTEELRARLDAQLAGAPSAQPPAGFSRWGGWLDRQWQASGFFRTQFEEGRWWLVDPDGHPFWSAGLDCVTTVIDSAYTRIEVGLAWLPPEEGAYAAAYREGRWGQRSVDYLVANLVRAYGDDWYARWSEIVPALMRDWGFNTVANWSDWHMASRAGLPYTRPLDPNMLRSQAIFRSFPDVFHPDFEADVADYAAQLRETRDDPAFLGYFLLNEPDWGFASQTLAEGMLVNTPHCAARSALAAFLQARYGDDAGLASAWGIETGLSAVADGPWTAALTPAAQGDLADFSTEMVARYFGALNAACKAVDPNHLNLGARYYTVPPAWVLKGMHGFDVFSINCYRRQVPADQLAYITETLGIPVMIGEWHFGALDVGLPGSGIGRTPDQAGRGQAYRVYVENAARIPSCVGVHYFTLYDQSAVGRFDGENYNIGFLDVCHRPYQELVEAARLTHQRLYPLVAGELSPTADEPEYLPLVFV